MQAIQSPTLTVDAQPDAGLRRDRQIYRLIDLHASAEAAGALHTAAIRAREKGDVLGQVLTDADLVLRCGASTEASAAHDRLREAAVSPEFLSLVPDWTTELRMIASTGPDTGACTLATALELWSWTIHHFLAESARLPSAAQAVDELAETLCPLLAARYLTLEVVATVSPGTPAEVEFRPDLCHVHAARSAALAGAACAELVFGYRRHLVWDAEGCGSCYGSDELDDLEAMMPGMASGAAVTPDVLGADGSHPAKAGPCARFDGVDRFMKMRNRLDGCLTGARIARDRAAAAIGRSMAGEERA